MSPFSRDPEELLSHRDYVRGLARSLVVDEARADDVVQQAWIAALADGPRESSSLRAWLGAVVRNLVWKSRREERRRRSREQQAARAGWLPSTAEVVEREAARRAVTDAVFALREPFRTTLILRHLQGLPQREIARRMSVPVETVHSRLRTGVGRLRKRLDAEYGDRRAWSLLMVPVAVPSAAQGLTPIAASLLAGVAIVSAKAKLLLSGLAIAAIALLFQLAGPGSGPVQQSPAQPATAAAEPPTSHGDPASSREPSREALAAEPPGPEVPATSDPIAEDPTRGDLELTITHAEDGSPAASVGVKVYCWAEADPYFNLRYGRTDERGVALIEGILAGTVTAEADRGGDVRADVVAGEISSAAIEISRGALVNGIVVDASGAPVAGADVFLTSQGLNSDGFIVARSAGDGRFSVRSVGRMHYIGARAAGYAPSQLPLVMGGEGTERDVTLTLDRRGGSLAGRVLGPDGKPLRGALVVVDPEVRDVVRLDDGTQALDAIELRTHTGDDGTFHFDSVRSGSRRIGVRRPDLAPWRSTVDVYEGVTARVEARLMPGAALVGTVTRQGGEPAARVRVEARQEDGFDEAYARTDEQGAFRLEGLPAGTVSVHATSDRHGEFEEELVLVAGQETRWDVQLSLGHTLVGRLVDEADRPLANHWIRAEVDYRHSKEHFDGDAKTGADGRFEVTNCPDAILRVKAFTPGAWMYPALTVEDVRPGGDELLLRLESDALPTAAILGVVVDPSGTPISGAKVTPSRSGANTSPILMTDADTGTFSVEPLPPGRYRITVTVPGFADFVTPFHDLLPNETWDLGEIRFRPAGHLVVIPRRDPDSPAADVHPWVERDGTGKTYKVERDGDRFLSEPLAEGSYHLFAASPPLATVAVPFQVRSGAETVVELPLRGGIERTILVESDERWIVLRVLRSEGIVFAGPLWRADSSEPFSKTLAFEPGEYTIEVEVGDDPGRTARRSFSVKDDGSSATVEISLP